MVQSLINFEQRMERSDNTSQGHVFISYTSEDEAAWSWSTRIRDHLQSLGQACWRDDESILAGGSIDRRVRNGLQDASALVLIISRSVLKSDWVMGELDMARSLGLPVIPAVVEPGVDVPIRLVDTKRVDFTAHEDRAWAALEAALGLAPPGQAMSRDLEVRYLDWLLSRRALAQNLALYIDLRADRETLAAPAHRDLDAEWLLPDLDHVAGWHPDTQDAPHVARTPLHDVRQALPLSRDFVILGESGSGKTFSLWRIAGELAGVARKDPAAPLPVIVPLRGWIQPVSSNDSQALARFVEQCATFRNEESVLGPLRGRFAALAESGRLALLLDGLNELPTHQRETKGQHVRDLLKHGPGSPARLVVTCRDADFQAKELWLPLDQVRVQPLRPPQIHRFLLHYFGFWNADEGEGLAEAFMWRLAGGEEMHGLWDAWHKARLSERAFWCPEPLERPPISLKDRWLPRRREHSQLLQRLSLLDTVRIRHLKDPRSLLRLAQNPYVLHVMARLGRNLGPQSLEGNRAVILGRFVDYLVHREDDAHRRREEGAPDPAASRAREMLGRLAWALQEKAGDLDKIQLSIDRPDAEALVGADTLAFARASNLLEGENTVSFSHQLLQEYFAAHGLRAHIRAGGLPAAQLWPRDRWWEPTGWEESVLFLAGLKAKDPGQVIEWLRDAQPAVLRQCIEEEGWQALSAEQLTDLRRRWMPRLDPAREPAPEGRHVVALALGGLGLDDRPGVGLKDGLPDIDWVEIPGGPFLYGRLYSSRELLSFFVARYPVTNAQYQAFIDGGGYKDERWWESAGRLGGPVEPVWSEPNCPRTDVSWYEATAFCHWLSNRLGQEIRLPTEIEWEKAARGTDGRIYPWGGRYIPGFAHVVEPIPIAGTLHGGINLPVDGYARSPRGDDVRYGPSPRHPHRRTTAVGIYPQGASPYGVQDMAGNVQEWCDSPRDASAEPHGKRALRGGGWNMFSSQARCIERELCDPGARLSHVGFRLCWSGNP
jgi:formylglycine-generating enzyme required for sulfatase activity